MIKLKTTLIREFNIMTKLSFVRVCSVALVLCVSLLGLLIATPVSASAGLTVDNALILATVTPGQTLTQKITVASSIKVPNTQVSSLGFLYPPIKNTERV